MAVREVSAKELAFTSNGITEVRRRPFFSPPSSSAALKSIRDPLTARRTERVFLSGYVRLKHRGLGVIKCYTGHGQFRSAVTIFRRSTSITYTNTTFTKTKIHQAKLTMSMKIN